MIDEKLEDKICGIVMPISTMDGCTDSHWAEVLNIISDAISDAGFSGNLVSNADDVGIIQKRIIQNLYDNPIVVCDVSCKNPNVMFELGLRLAFDKPTIIIKDDETSYSFDTSPIEHIEYPRDLRFTQIVDFKEKLTEKIIATYKKSTEDEHYTTFLKHFGEFKVAKIDKKEVSGQEFILEELKSLRRSINNNPNSRKSWIGKRFDSDIDICMGKDGKSSLNDAMSILMEHPALTNMGVKELHPDHYHLIADVDDNLSVNEVRDEVEHIVGRKIRRRPTKDKSING